MPRKLVKSGYPFEEEYGYSRAIRVGNFAFVSGTTARGDDLKGDAFVQASAILEIIKTALTEVGLSINHVVRTVVYVTNLSDQVGIAKAHNAVFSKVCPASTLVQVAALTPSSARVEIEVTAFLDEKEQG